MNQNNNLGKITIPRNSATLPKGISQGELIDSTKNSTVYAQPEKGKRTSKKMDILARQSAFMPSSTINQLK